MGPMHMMTFQSHSSLALQMIALVSGLLLFNKAATTEFFCKKTGKVLGGLVVVVSLLLMICTFTLTIRGWCNQKGCPTWHHPQTEMPGRPSMPDQK